MLDRTALVTGITGQDGSYLAESLLQKGYRLVGTSRRASAGLGGTSISSHDVELVEWDLRSQESIEATIAKYRPSEVYNFAGFSTGAGMYDDPLGIGDVNGLAVVRILEAIQRVDVSIRFCQASSREIFGEATESPQTERTPVSPRSPYGAAKLYADAMIKIYRERHGVFAASAILFNHESPRRGLSFITRKITYTAARIKLGMENELKLGSLDARRDWGFAGDYVEAMWLMLQQSQPSDYVIATGVSHSVLDVCRIAFEHVGLDYRDYVRGDASMLRPNEPFPLVGDITKAREQLGWQPRLGFKDLICQMVDSDLVLSLHEQQ